MVEDPRQAQKRAAALAAAAEVHSGMVLGLGTGSTTFFAVQEIGERYARGELRDLVGIATSERTAAQARAYGLPLATLATHSTIDLAVDGADEVDPALDLIKGLGGALLREKAVERCARRLIVIVDEGKLVGRLGTKAPLPVEVGRADWQRLATRLAALGCTPTLRGGDSPFVTDNQNFILDCHFPGGIADAAGLARALDAESGVLAHGLFIGMASVVIVAGQEGIRTLGRE